MVDLKKPFKIDDYVSDTDQVDLESNENNNEHNE